MREGMLKCEWASNRLTLLEVGICEVRGEISIEIHLLPKGPASSPSPLTIQRQAVLKLMSATFGLREPHDVACAEVATHTVHTHIYVYIPWTSRPWEFPGSMGIHGVFRENTVHLIFQVFFPAWSALESIMQYKITHNPDMWCQGSCGCQMQILNFYTSDLSGDVRGWKKTNKNSPMLTHANPWKTLGICMCLHGFFMGIAWVQHGVGYSQCIPFS